MTEEQLDIARAEEAMRLSRKTGNGCSVVVIAARLARENWAPPMPDPEVGDVFKNIGGTHSAEWTISMIDGDACIMRYLTGHISVNYPLDPALWEFVRKGTAA